MEEKKATLNPEEIDILKEVGNICVGNSSSILSQLLGGQVDVHLPGLDFLSVHELGNYIKEKGKMVYGVNAQLSSNVQGSIFLLFPEKHSLKIISKFMNDVDVQGAESIKFGISIIKEIAGISIFSYINTLSSMIRKMILTSVPNFLSGSADELLNMMMREQEQMGNICIIHTTFKEKSMDIEGSYYLILDKKSADLLVDYMRNPV